jgi:hypothetical protein
MLKYSDSVIPSEAKNPATSTVIGASIQCIAWEAFKVPGIRQR